MKLVKPKVELLPQKHDIYSAVKMVELAGRTCYKSEGNIKCNSSYPFYDRMVKLGHTSVLEHGTIYLELDERDKSCKYIPIFKQNKFSKSIKNRYKHYVTTNLRVIQENNLHDAVFYSVKPSFYHDERFTFRITTSRIISQQFHRHRVFSVSQESQRYCNYSKDRFGDDILFIDPIWLTDKENSVRKTLIRSYKESEKNYFDLTSKGVKAEDARDVLANGVKTEFIYTGFESDFLGNFKNLRTHRTAQKLIQIQAKEICSIITSNQIEKY